jgi:hypothetical protein
MPFRVPAHSRRLARHALLLACPMFALTRAADAQLQVSTPSVVEHTLRAGERREGHIEILNQSAEPQEVSVYQADYQFSADGQTRYAAAGTTPRSNARWLAVAPARLRIEAGATARVGYVLVVPTAGPLNGTHWSLVMIEGGAPGRAEAPRAGRGRASVGVGIAIRHAVQVVTRIDGAPARTAMTLGNSSIATAAGGGREMTIDAANSGEVAVRPLLRVEVYNEAGAVVATASQQRGLVYPGSSVRQRFQLGSLPRGTYHAMVVADTGADEMFGARVTLTF